MKRTHRLRRAMASLALGVGAVAGAVGLTAGVAGAAVTSATVTATSTTIAYVGTNQPAGTVTVTLPAGTMATTTLTVGVANVTKTTGATPSSVTFSSAPTVVGTNIHATLTTAAFPAASITIHLTGKSAPVAATIKISGIKYTTSATPGVSKDVKVTPAIAGVAFTPTSVSNAAYPPPVATTPTFMALTGQTQRPLPPVGVGATGAAAGSWLLYLEGTSTQGVGKGSFVTVSVAPHTGTNNCTGTNAVAFAATPTVALTTKRTGDVSATPTFTVAMHGTGTGCSTKFAPNKLRITFTNTVTFTHGFGGIILAITGVKYSTAFKTTPGTVTVGATYFRFTGATGPNTVSATTFPFDQPTNAIVAKAYVTVTPAKMAANAFDHKITPIKVVESVAGSVPTGYVCVSLADSERTTATGWIGTTTLNPTHKTPNFFNTSSKGTLKVTGGNGAASTLHFVGAAGTTASVIAFKVTAKSTSASTYVISGLSVNSDANGFSFPPVVTVRYATTATCATVPAFPNNGPTDNVAVAYLTTPVTTRVYGSTADATAAAELQLAFRGTGSSGSCPGLSGTNFTLHSTGQRPVVLTRDNGYPDALASQYLAQYLNTGTLLTPPTTLSTVTAAAIRHEGITHVYVVGGPLAVSTAVVDQLQTTPVYHCGGRNLQTTATGAPIYIQVTRIYGATQYDTAQQVAQYVPTTQVHSLNLAGAYAGTNATKGNGMYNQTAGTASTAPKVTGFQRTAILATGTTFQDAEAASALSYSESLPILLTTPTALSAQARMAIQTLNISQVIVMGGPLAVSNTVVKALEAMTVSVLRVAGKTYSETSVQLANLEVGEATGHAGLDWDTNAIMVARGTFFSDGIAGAVLEHTFNRLNTATSQTQVPLVLTQSPTQLGSALTAWLKSSVSTGIDGTPTETITHVLVLGGPLAVSTAVVAQINTILGL